MHWPPSGRRRPKHTSLATQGPTAAETRSRLAGFGATIAETAAAASRAASRRPRRLRSTTPPARSAAADCLAYYRQEIDPSAPRRRPSRRPRPLFRPKVFLRHDLAAGPEISGPSALLEVILVGRAPPVEETDN